ncbi:MAG: septum formation inhibitor Maf [Chromatiales bacterium]|nr:septum formation inhibitor Maf [Chromatiales bacterium]
MTARAFVYLASGSPRRRELLAQLGIACEVLRVAVDETPRPGEKADDLVCRLAAAKARAGMELPRVRPAPVVAADTAVALGAELFGKPVDEADAVRMLTRLGGRTHEVWTAVAIAEAGRERVELSRSEVSFRAIDAREAAAYWRTGEPVDKAGGYGIQGLGAIFISALKGSYSGVMGLPLFETARLLESFSGPLLEAMAADE